ncbi:hypothetical protein AGMMS50212_01440 [Spirochaetia bacterium]|nr:hypothetical protein AGMMS50212_01440 [Spirochaetia bacterium]
MDAGTGFSLLTLFKLGGIFMWPLLLFSIATITIALERIIYIVYHNLKVDDLGKRVDVFFRKKDIEGAVKYLSAQTDRRIGARVLLSLVNHCNLPASQVEKIVESEARCCVNSLESGFDFLVALGSVAPLTGFLGTVSGMIGAFKSIAEATEVNAQIVAGGIYEALITTVFGLIIAIIAMVTNSLLSHSVDKFSAELEQNCSSLITYIAIHEN